VNVRANEGEFFHMWQMDSRKLFVTLSLAGVAIIPAGIGGAGEAPRIDAAWQAKLTTEGKACYEKYQALAQRLEEESESRIAKLPGHVGKTTLAFGTRRVRTVRLGDNMIIDTLRILEKQPKHPIIRLKCSNMDYHFELAQSGEKSAYALVEYGKGKPKIPLVNQHPGLHAAALRELRDVLTAAGVFAIPPGLALRGLQFESKTGLLRAEFRTTYPKDLAKFAPDTQVFLDPVHDWRPVESRSQNAYQTATTVFTYGQSVEDLEFPTESKSRTIWKVPDFDPNSESTHRLVSIKVTDKTAVDFRLSAFGLPEPIDFPPPPKSKWYLWILAGACICGAMALFFRYRYRRARASAPSPSTVAGSS
jgi:hypothetical protein